MLGSIVLVAAFTATLSSQMTTESVAGAIACPASLPSRTIATVEGTHADKDLREMRAVVHGYRDVAAAIASVQDGKADVAVYDAPVLSHEIKQNPRSPVRLVGPVFEH
jgi:polar amino acid transport system substrate-binding protein